MKIKTLKLLCAASMSLVLAACGGGEGSAFQKEKDTLNQSSASSTSSTFNGGGNSSAATSSIDTTKLSNIGFGTGNSFQAGKIGVGIGNTILAPGGETSLTVNLVSITGTLIIQSLSVTFNSTCLAGKQASMTPEVVSTTNGEASTVYKAKGCQGNDLVTATVTADGQIYYAQTTLQIAADTVQTISFISASPESINLKETGGAEASTLSFVVKGQNDTAIKGVCVTFSASTTQGGLALVPSKCMPAGAETYGATTNSEGVASVVVQSGTVATPVRVTATADGKSTQSSTLVITTGIPDQNSISMNPANLSPVSWKHDNIKTTVTALMADAFNNKVPEGTAVTFTTSGGSIDASCTTKDGACTVNWRSQLPRPTSSDQVIFSDTYPFAMSCTSGSTGECRSGRVKILATAIGNESFIDGNGNGVYDDISKDIFVNSSGFYNSPTPIDNRALCNPAQPHSTASRPPVKDANGNYGLPNSCDDLREAYLDKDFDGDHSSFEEIVDFNQDGIFNDVPNGKYDGALCSGAAKLNGDCTTNKVNVRAESMLVMSCEAPFFQPLTLLAPNSRLPGIPVDPVVVPPGGSESLPMLLADCNGNGIPTGTTLSLKSSLINASAEVSPAGPTAMSTEPGIIYIDFKAVEDASKLPSGFVTLEISVPDSSGGKLVTSVRVRITHQ